MISLFPHIYLCIWWFLSWFWSDSFCSRM